MGDGTTVVCTKRGTPYADSFGRRSSPDCGHTYTRQGRYTVRATSYWIVDWAGIGQTGTIPMNFTSTGGDHHGRGPGAHPMNQRSGS